MWSRASCEGGAVELDDVEVHNPAGQTLVSDLNLRLAPGDAMIIAGESGSGKTTLLRSVAQLWPFTSGTVRCPVGENAMMFLSRLPYVPLGGGVLSASIRCDSGRNIVCGIGIGGTTAVTDRLDEVNDWAQVLSPGEQQRVAFARILLTKPKVVFLDEATSALDEPLEFMIYGLVRRELPETVFVSVTHRSTVNRHHDQHLQLLGDGRWRFGPLGAPV